MVDFSKPRPTSYQEATQEIDVNEFIKVVKSRRSVRVYDGTKIPEEVVNSCLDLALLAPNSSNLQPWNFYWVRSQSTKDEIVKACYSQPAAATAAELIVCVARTNTWRENRNKMLELFDTTPGVADSAIHYYKKLVPFVYSLGFLGIFGLLKKVIFFILGFKGPTIREPTTKSDLINWASKTTCLACENLMLSFRAYSFDTCPMEGFDSYRVKKILKLPKDSYITMIISAGKRAENGIYGPQVRFDRKNFIQEV